jgi:hypothetical protein
VTSDHAIEGSVHAPQPSGPAAVLAAYREATGWTDEDALHYATCALCDPLGGDSIWCSDSPRERRWQTANESRRPPGEPVRPQPPLPPGLRRQP